MAKKVNPKIFRVGINERWLSDWYAPMHNISKFVHEDRKIRGIVTKFAKPAGIDKIVISRNSDNVFVDLYVGRPGIAIGKSGSGVENIEKEIKQKLGINVKVSVFEVKQPYLSAAIVAQTIQEAMQKRVPPKVIMNQMIEKIEISGAKGARIQIAGIGPIKQARTEKVEMKGGKIPLTTMRAKIDYAFTNVLVDKMYGIKVWIYKGEL